MLLQTTLEDSQVMPMTKKVSCLKLFLNSCTAIHPQQKVYSQNVKSQRYTVHFSTPDKLLETADTVYQIHTSIRKPQKSTLVRSKHNKENPKSLTYTSISELIELVCAKLSSIKQVMTQCQDEVRTYSAGTHILKVFKWG